MYFNPDTIATSEALCAWFNIGAERPIRQSTFRTWVARGQLDVHGKRDGLNLYRYGDVDQLVATRRKRSTVTLPDARSSVHSDRRAVPETAPI